MNFIKNFFLILMYPRFWYSCIDNYYKFDKEFDDWINAEIKLGKFPKYNDRFTVEFAGRILWYSDFPPSHFNSHEYDKTTVRPSIITKIKLYQLFLLNNN